ncbi:predicted Zn-dependent hydrolase [Moesziomyces antarcticus T-34]|uniref:Predicted Zn-dependent hydrolase n=1 Tax=Pseudozyma antarctica (strain T-34) TaxID=1151754 RepID=M9MBA5_PSEA3|nr:predicted Zn-dependent hydrolase [Moesziomyces antarcticus T-34]
MCTPAQHGSGRGAGDKDASLWASWVVEWNNDGGRFAAFFAGDTGLKFHHDSPEKRHKYPACPAFGEIARRCGPFDLLLLPISVGSSLSYFRSWDPFPRAMSPFPRVSGTLTSSIHMDPYDAVECHTIFKAEEKKASKVVSLAVHYGTFVRNEEQTRADVRELRQACSKQRLRFARVRDETALLHSQSKDDVFIVADQGKTVWLPIHTS